MNNIPNKVNINLNDNAKKVVIWVGVVIVLVAFFRLITQLKKST